MDTKTVATKIIKLLKAKGHTAYFAGGWVRDFLLKHPSSDIDIATDATPSEVQSYFQKTYPVGASFGVVIVREDDFNFEVATFRSEGNYQDGRHPEEVQFTTPQEDALRRDFTINGMFYDPLAKKILDFVDGESDLKNKVVRAIGCPKERFEEDRLRMLRAVRFTAQLNFSLDPSTATAIKDKASSVYPCVSVERVWQELIRIAQNPRTSLAFTLLNQLGLLEAIFPKEAKLHLCDEALDRFTSKEIPELFVFFLFNSLTNTLIDSLAKHFKISKTQKRAIQDANLFLEAVKNNLSNETKWTKLLAHKNSNVHANLAKSFLSEKDSVVFTREHDNRLKSLELYIQQVKNNSPFVTAQDLKKLGVSPGPKMGRLLKIAFETSVNQRLKSKEDVLKALSNQLQ